MISRNGTVAALGNPVLLQGYRLAGVRVYPAAGEAAVREAWSSLPDTVAVVLLTPDAERCLGADVTAAGAPLTVVLPQ